METQKKLTCEQANRMDIAGYLRGIGYEPQKIRGNNYWYLSPLRNESTASFKINLRLNRWYDFGIGKGGNLVDFGVLYHHCSVAELLQILSANLSFPKQHFFDITTAEKETSIQVIGEEPLSAPALVQYLTKRKIALSIAAHYCREVRYKVNYKEYYGIGFKNDLGGYEIRNPYFKSSSAPKGITTIDMGYADVAVFEGFFDFLSYLSYVSSCPARLCNYVVLNSLSFYEKALPFIAGHTMANLFLDRDTAGQNCSRQALSTSEKFMDRSGLYDGFKDFNEWWVNSS